VFDLVKIGRGHTLLPTYARNSEDSDRKKYVEVYYFVRLMSGRYWDECDEGLGYQLCIYSRKEDGQ
jgi:hypothetical protein